MIPELLAGLLLGLFTDGWTTRLAGSALIGLVRCVELVRERRRLWKRIQESLGDEGSARNETARRLMRSLLDAELRLARVPPWALFPGQFLISAGLTLAMSLLVTEVKELLG